MDVREITNATVMQIDYAREERQAFLHRRFHFRRDWWRLYAWLAGKVSGLPVESAMFRFHWQHHQLTVWRFHRLTEFRDIKRLIQEQGVVAGVRDAFRRS